MCVCVCVYFIIHMLQWTHNRATHCHRLLSTIAPSQRTKQLTKRLTLEACCCCHSRCLCRCHLQLATDIVCLATLCRTDTALMWLNAVMFAHCLRLNMCMLTFRKTKTKTNTAYRLLPTYATYIQLTAITNKNTQTKVRRHYNKRLCSRLA